MASVTTIGREELFVQAVGDGDLVQVVARDKGVHRGLGVIALLRRHLQLHGQLGHLRIGGLPPPSSSADSSSRHDAASASTSACRAIVQLHAAGQWPPGAPQRTLRRAASRSIRRASLPPSSPSSLSQPARTSSASNAA